MRSSRQMTKVVLNCLARRIASFIAGTSASFTASTSAKGSFLFRIMSASLSLFSSIGNEPDRRWFRVLQFDSIRLGVGYMKNPRVSLNLRVLSRNRKNSEAPCGSADESLFPELSGRLVELEVIRVQSQILEMVKTKSTAPLDTPFPSSG